mmetsp:Transcript_13537/g.28843  ORF Transcript_13537/g.28843 Transcript_13537/m.28843 type:complete len:259 (+) Transcript_13537:363-1139(+)
MRNRSKIPLRDGSSYNPKGFSGSSKGDISELAVAEQEDWEKTVLRLREANCGVSKLVTHYERCVAVQGASGEEVGDRVESAKRLDELRRQVVSLHENLLANLVEGSSEGKKSAFFTECYNFTSSVDRLTKALSRSLRKQRKVIENNRSEMELMSTSVNLSEAERVDAVSQCLGFEEICVEKEKAVMKIKEDLQGRIAELRGAASTALQQHDTASEEHTQPRRKALLRAFEGRTKAIGAVLIIFVLCLVGSRLMFVQHE